MILTRTMLNVFAGGIVAVLLTCDSATEGFEGRADASRIEATGQCFKIRASMTGVFPDPGPCDAQFGCGSGEIRGSIVHGTHRAEVLAMEPSAGLPDVDPNVLSFYGRRTFFTMHGTIEFELIGIFDTRSTSNLDYSEMNRVLSGTGWWAGATGLLQMHGDAQPDGTFKGPVRGTICIP